MGDEPARRPNGGAPDPGNEPEEGGRRHLPASERLRGGAVEEAQGWAGEIQDANVQASGG